MNEQEKNLFAQNICGSYFQKQNFPQIYGSIFTNFEVRTKI